jgi:hypothetical protein
VRSINGLETKMSKNIARRARLIGLVSALVAVVAIGITLIAGFSFGKSLTPLQQLSLLLAAAVLWAVHMPVHLGGRYRSRNQSAARKITQFFKARRIVRLLWVRK